MLLIAAGTGNSHTRETDANVEWHTSCTPVALEFNWDVDNFSHMVHLN